MLVNRRHQPAEHQHQSQWHLRARQGHRRGIGPDFAPIGTTFFDGVFDGNSHTISNLTIAPTAPAPPASVSDCSARLVPPAWCATSFPSTTRPSRANPNVTDPASIRRRPGRIERRVRQQCDVTNSTVSNGTANNGVIAGGLIGQNGIFGPGASMGTITTVECGGERHCRQCNVRQLRQQRGRTGRRQSRHDHAVDRKRQRHRRHQQLHRRARWTKRTRRHDQFVARDRQRPPVERHRQRSRRTCRIQFRQHHHFGRGWRGHRRRKHGYLQGRFPGRTCRAAGCRWNDQHVFRGRQCECRREQLRGRPGRLNNGTIIGSGAGGTVFSLDNTAGGLVGFNGIGATITGSVATGNVSGGGHNTGGLVGDNAGTIVGSFAFGNVTATSFENDAGGFAGK